jgi:hypothetical protein
MVALNNATLFSGLISLSCGLASCNAQPASASVSQPTPAATAQATAPTKATVAKPTRAAATTSSNSVGSSPQAAPAERPAATPAAPRQAPPAATPTPPATTPTTPIVASNQMVDSLPPVEVTPPSIDMGVVPPKTSKSGIAELKNTGTTPLKILAVTPSCKCTTTNELAGTIIPPGGSVKLEATLEPVSMPQTQKAELRILIEGYGKILSVPVRGETAMPVRANPTLINAVEGQPRAGRFVVESIDRKPFTICAVGGRKPEFLGFRPGVDQPKSTYLLKYDLDTWQPTFPAYLVIETDREDCPAFDVWIRSENTIPRPGFRMKDYRVNLGRVDVGASVETSVEMEDPGEDMLAAESMVPEIGVELLGQSVSQVGEAMVRKVNLRVTPRTQQTGLFYTQFKLYSRDKEQVITLFGTQRPKDAKGCVGCVAVDAPPSRDPAGRAPAPAGDSLGGAPGAGRPAPR